MEYGQWTTITQGISGSEGFVEH